MKSIKVETSADLMLPFGVIAIPAQLTYSTELQPAVTLRLRDIGGVWVEWVMARDLLDMGLTSDEPIGEGDVSVWVEDAEVVVRLRNGAAAAHVRLDVEDVEEFLSESFAAVALGDESVTVPDDISELT